MCFRRRTARSHSSWTSTSRHTDHCRGLGVESEAREAHRLRRAETGDLYQAGRHPAAAERPDRRVSVGEHRMVATDQKVTAKGEFEAARDGRTVDGPYQRLGDPAKAVDERANRAPVGVWRREDLQVQS